MIQIQLKDGRVYKTDHINFVTLNNTPCIEFWYTLEDKTRHKNEVAISKIDNLTSTAEESIKKLHKDVAEVMVEISSKLSSLKDDLRVTS